MIRPSQTLLSYLGKTGHYRCPSPCQSSISFLQQWTRSITTTTITTSKNGVQSSLHTNPNQFQSRLFRNRPFKILRTHEQSTHFNNLNNNLNHNNCVSLSRNFSTLNYNNTTLFNKSSSNLQSEGHHQLKNSPSTSDTIENGTSHKQEQDQTEETILEEEVKLEAVEEIQKVELGGFQVAAKLFLSFTCK